MAKSKSTKKTPAAKTPAAAPATAAKGPGVIDTLCELLLAGGGTRAELYDGLIAKFPGRASPKGGVRTTIAIQLKALHKKGRLVVTSEDVEGRGTVYSATLPAKPE